MQLGPRALQLQDPLGLTRGHGGTFPGDYGYIVYALCDRITGQFLKWGITNSGLTRYRKGNQYRLPLPGEDGYYPNLPFYLEGRPVIMIPVRVDLPNSRAARAIEWQLRNNWGGPANNETDYTQDSFPNVQQIFQDNRNAGFQQWILNQGLGIPAAIANIIHPAIPGYPGGRALRLDRAAAAPPPGWPAGAIFIIIAIMILIIGAGVVAAIIGGPTIIAGTGTAIAAAGSWITGIGTAITGAGEAIAGTVTASAASAGASHAATIAQVAQQLPPMG